MPKSRFGAFDFIFQSSYHIRRQTTVSSELATTTFTFPVRQQAWQLPPLVEKLKLVPSTSVVPFSETTENVSPWKGILLLKRYQ
jgi:hypothetical protein